MKKESSEPVSKRPKKEAEKSEFEDFVDPFADFNIAIIDRDDGELYGCFGFAPACLQFCRREPVAFLGVLCLLATAATYIQNGVLPQSFTQLQQRFHLTNYDLAVFRIMFDIGSLLALGPVVYYGEFGVHRPQWISMGGLMVGVGAIVLTIPHFLEHAFVAEETKNDICHSPNSMWPNSTAAARACPAMMAQKAAFMIGELLIGFGSAPYYVMGLTYLDENATHRQSTLYTALFSMCRLLGPFLSGIFTSQLLKIDGDINRHAARVYVEETVNRTWYGAWWLSMLVGGVASILGAILMFPFPSELSGAAVAHIRDTREAMLMASQTDYSYDDPATGDPRLSKKLKDIFGNRVFLGTIVEMCVRFFMVSGIAAFLPKYLETMFETDPVHASLQVGVVVVTASLFGLMFGTLLQYLFHLEVGGNLRLSLVSTVASLLLLSSFGIKCPTVNFAGVNVPYNASESSKIDLNNACNMNCKCDELHFEPVCDAQQEIMYYSKCFAGCTQFFAEDKTNRTGTNCSCLVNFTGTVVRGRCGKCSSSRLWAYLIALSWLGIFLWMRYNSIQQILLRAVHFKLRSMSLAMSMVFMHVTASIPAPFAFAALLNSACAKRVDHCGYFACVWFNKNELAMAWIVSLIPLSFVCLFALAFALVSHKPTGQVLAVVVPKTEPKSKIVTKPKSDEVKANPASKKKG